MPHRMPVRAGRLVRPDRRTTFDAAHRHDRARSEARPTVGREAIIRSLGSRQLLRSIVGGAFLVALSIYFL